MYVSIWDTKILSIPHNFSLKKVYFILTMLLLQNTGLNYFYTYTNANVKANTYMESIYP